MREQLSEYELKLKINLPNSLLNSLVGSYDNLQNDPKITATIKECFYISKELVDFVILFPKNLIYDFITLFEAIRNQCDMK